MTFDKGIFVISFDTELAWGTNGSPRFLDAYRNTRAVVCEILDILERHRLSATWAVVGELFKEPQEQNDIWHAADMIRNIINCPVRQEIGCHSFSHTIHNQSCDADCMRKDLAMYQNVVRNWEIKPESFVYPRNRVKYTDQLAAHGFRIFRDADNVWYNLLPGALKRIGHVLDAYCLSYAPIGTLTQKEGICAVSGNQLFMHSVGWARWLPAKFQVRKACNGLYRATQERKIFHLWTHPFNLATNPKKLLPGFNAICARAAQLRDGGVLENMTMGQLAQRYG